MNTVEILKGFACLLDKRKKNEYHIKLEEIDIPNYYS